MKALILWAALSTAAAQPAFEVVSIKPAPPVTHGQGVTVGMRGGPFSGDPTRWTCENMSLYNLISVAYNLKSYELNAPDWTQSTSFDLNARLSAPATKDQFRAMLQGLLVERFGLKTHREWKEAQGFELVVAKTGAKFKQSAPVPKAGAASADGQISLGPDGFPVIPVGMTAMASVRGRARAQWLRHTMAELASNLSDQIRRPVADATGLVGKYDISLYWVTDNLRTPPPSHSGDLSPAPEVSGPNLFTAVQEQLGLKLEGKRVGFWVLVVDAAQKTPTED